MEKYARVHNHRTNLSIHIVAVPLFMIANLGLLLAIILLKPIVAIVCVAIAIASMAAQGKGHKLEQNSPKPFKGFVDFIWRFYVEQFYIFPRFVISGQWWQTWRQAKVIN